jgi:Flp pilus assembly protein TadG
MKTVWAKLCRTFSDFRVARGGNVAVAFAVAVIPVLGCVGAAVDYSRANAVKASMQAALDSTALMLSKEAATDTSAQLQQNASKYFLALFTRPEATNITVTATYSSTGGSQVEVDGQADVPTTFFRILHGAGFPELDNITVHGMSTSKWGSSRLRVALVLDNTGSMADNGKIGALKTATTNLLAQLQAAASVDGDVYVSIVPFVKDVSFDPTSYTSSWDSWIMWDDNTDSSWDGSNGSCSKSGYSPRSSCTAQSACSISGYTTQNTCTAAGTCSVSGYSTQSTCTAAGTCSNGAETTQSNCTGNKACSKSQYNNKNQCQSNNGTWGFGTWTSLHATWTVGVWGAAKWTPANHTTWNGCITDRGISTGPSQDYDRLVTQPSSSITASRFPAEQYSSCPLAMVGLNYDWTSMKAMVNTMVANGSTNQPIGLVWGWQTLVGGGPFTSPAMDTNYQYQQIIILLSDGLNTQDRWYGNGSSTSTQVDSRMLDSTGAGTCANIKAGGVVIYTIQVNTGGDPTSTLMENCASNTTGTTDHFFLLTSASEIVTTFNTIGTNLTKLRVAR